MLVGAQTEGYHFVGGRGVIKTPKGRQVWRGLWPHKILSFFHGNATVWSIFTVEQHSSLEPKYKY